MKQIFHISLLSCIIPSLIQSTNAASTYTTTSGEVNLVVGLTNLSTSTAINTINQSVGIDYITDNSWSTGVFNLGGIGVPPIANNGILAGTFGGATFYGSSNQIILIGGGVTSPAWGSWTIRLLLSDDTYSSAFSFNDNDLIVSPVMSETNSLIYQNRDGSIFSSGSSTFNTFYQELNIAAFDSNNIGFKGIELSNTGNAFPDLTYIGVTQAVPEPSASILGLLGAGLILLRRRVS